MSEKEYIPHPADLSGVALPAQLLELAEEISKNVHEVWAQNRMNEGWTYGPERDHKKRTTPCLIPYEQLPEEEKAYDRETALNTLKYILSLGFQITRS